MKINKEILKFLPEEKKSIAELIVDINYLKSKMKSTVIPSTKQVTPKLLWKYDIYLQLITHRTVDLAESIVASLNRKHVASSLISCRALYETIALFYVSCKKTNEIIIGENFKILNEYIDSLNFGTRIEEFQPYKAHNILTIIDKVTKDFPPFRIWYERLCEFAHPQHFSLFGLYGKMENETTCLFDKNFAFSRNNAGLIFTTLFLCINVARFTFDKFQKHLTQIRKIAIDYEKSHPNEK